VTVARLELCERLRKLVQRAAAVEEWSASTTVSEHRRSDDTKKAVLAILYSLKGEVICV